MTVPTGYLIVRARDTGERGGEGELMSSYRGVDRVPALPADDKCEQEALDQYVFGGFKEEEGNLIACFEDALRLHALFSAGKHRYEILYCCEGLNAIQGIAGGGVDIECLGYDVAAISGDYWSIVGDMADGAWAEVYRRVLNEYGLFACRNEAEAYLWEYRRRQEADHDVALDVVYVARVTSRGKGSR